MKNLFLSWEPSHIASVSDKAVGVTLENTCVISEVQYFDFLVSYLYTFNPLSSSSKWVTTLVATTYRNMENGQSWKTTYMTMVRWLERTPFIFVFKLKIHIRQMKLSRKSRNGKETILYEYSLCCSCLIIKLVKAICFKIETNSHKFLLELTKIYNSGENIWT